MSNISFKQRLSEILQNGGAGFSFSAAGRTSTEEATLSASGGVSLAAASSRITLTLTDPLHREEVLASNLVDGVFAVANLAPCDFCVLDSNGVLVMPPVIYRDRVSYIDFSDFSEDSSFTILERSYADHGCDFDEIDSGNHTGSCGRYYIAFDASSRLLTVGDASPADFRIAVDGKIVFPPMTYANGDTTVDLTELSTNDSSLHVFWIPSRVEEKTTTAQTTLEELGFSCDWPGTCCVLDDGDEMIRPPEAVNVDSKTQTVGQCRLQFVASSFTEGIGTSTEAFSSDGGKAVRVRSSEPLERMIYAPYCSYGELLFSDGQLTNRVSMFFKDHTAASIGTNQVETSINFSRNRFTFDMPDTAVKQGKAEIALFFTDWMDERDEYSWRLTSGTGETVPFGTFAEVEPQHITTFYVVRGSREYTFPCDLTPADGQRIAILYHVMLPFVLPNISFPRTFVGQDNVVWDLSDKTLEKILLKEYSHGDLSGHYFLDCKRTNGGGWWAQSWDMEDAAEDWMNLDSLEFTDPPTNYHTIPERYSPWSSVRRSARGLTTSGSAYSFDNKGETYITSWYSRWNKLFSETIPTGQSVAKRLIDSGAPVVFAHDASVWKMESRSYAFPEEISTHYLNQYPEEHPLEVVTQGEESRSSGGGTYRYYTLTSTTRYQHSIALTGGQKFLKWSSTNEAPEDVTVFYKQGDIWASNTLFSYYGYKIDWITWSNCRVYNWYIVPVTVVNLMTEPFPSWAVTKNKNLTQLDFNDNPGKNASFFVAYEVEDLFSDGVQWISLGESYNEGETRPFYYDFTAVDTVTQLLPT